MGTIQPQFSLDSLRSHFKVMRECPVCTFAFENIHIRTVESTEGSHVLHTTCPSCSNSLIFLVGSTQFGIGLIGMVSDLSYEDSLRFRRKEAIGEDELIACYQAFSKPRLFRQLFSSI
jgi:hypothetical protein